MTMIYALNHTTANHLAAVTAEMETLGAPTIRVVDCGDHYIALEGSHRLAAAHALGLEPFGEDFSGGVKSALVVVRFCAVVGRGDHVQSPCVVAFSSVRNY